MAAKPIMVLSSDWHLSPLSWKRHPKIRGDSYYSLQQIVDTAIELQVPLIGAGDLFDIKAPPSESVVFCCEQMKRLEREGLSMYYVQGQHEYADTPWLTLAPNAVHIDSFKYQDKGEPRVFDVAGLRVVGLDISTSPVEFAIQCAKLHAVAKSKGEFDLFVTHQVWADFIKKRDPVFMLEKVLFSKITYTGDYHKLEALDINGMLCLSSGSINMQANNENPIKEVFILHDDLSVSKKTLKTRPFMSFELKNDDDLLRLLNTPNSTILSGWPHYVPDEFATPLVSVKYQNSLSNAFDSLTEKFKDWNYDLSPTDFLSVEMTAATDRKEVREIIDLSDCVAQFVPSDSTAYKDALRMFEAVDVESELTNMRKEHLNQLS
jgi:hypothetical protein